MSPSREPAAGTEAAPTDVPSAARSPQSPTAGRCANCGAPLSGPFCAACGQRDVGDHEWSVRHFFGHVLHELTHLDANKILRTLGALLFQPGRLSQAYLAGRRLQYIGPIRVYLVCSAIFFLAVWSRMLTAYGYRSHPALVDGIARVAEAQQIPVALYQEHFNHSLDRYAGILWFLGVFAVGAILHLLFRRVRPYYVQHLVVALHLMSFEFFVRAGGVGLAKIADAINVPVLYHGLWGGYLVQLGYAYLALRHVYRQSAGATALKAVTLMLLTFVVVVFVLWGATTLAFALT